MEVVVSTGVQDMQSFSQIVTINKPTLNTHLFNMTDDALPVAQPTVSRHWRKIKALKENLHSALKMLNCNINQDDAIGDDDDETTNANYYFWCEFNQLAFPQFFQVRPSP